MSKWEKVKMGDICTIFKGKKIESVEQHDNSIRMLQIEDLRNNNNIKYCDMSKKLVVANEEDIILAWDGANAGTIGFGLYGAIGSTLAVLRIKTSLLDSRYVGFLLRGKNTYLRNNCTGATIPHINRRALENIEIPIPPLEVQKQIAQKLDTASELLALRKRQLEELDELIKSMFYNMFGDPVLNKMRWETQPMLSAGKFVSGGTPSKERNDYWRGNFPWISPKDMKVPYISKSQNCISNNVFEETSLKKIAPGHVLIVVRGMILAHSFPTAINTVEVSINQDMKAILPIDEINVLYLKHCLDNMTHQILKIITTAAHGTKKFDTDSMGKVFIPVPPLSLQNEFATIVTKIEEQKSLVKQSIEETLTLFDSLMSQYFD